MQMVAPSGPMYQAGTLSGNPLTMAAGIATLKELCKPGTWDSLVQHAAQLDAGFRYAAASVGVSVRLQRVGTMSTTFFTDQPVRDWTTARQADTTLYAKFFRAMLNDGVYLAPSQFEAGFLSTAHGEPEIDQSIRAAQRAFRNIVKE
jgi:glutamate-1-semialdehyde 2,1-aminomutase